jgi:hypothetical protein
LIHSRDSHGGDVLRDSGQYLVESGLPFVVQGGCLSVFLFKLFALIGAFQSKSRVVGDE